MIPVLVALFLYIAVYLIPFFFYRAQHMIFFMTPSDVVPMTAWIPHLMMPYPLFQPAHERTSSHRLVPYLLKTHDGLYSNLSYSWEMIIRHWRKWKNFITSGKNIIYKHREMSISSFLLW